MRKTYKVMSYGLDEEFEAIEIPQKTIQKCWRYPKPMPTIRAFTLWEQPFDALLKEFNRAMGFYKEEYGGINPSDFGIPFDAHVFEGVRLKGQPSNKFVFNCEEAWGINVDGTKDKLPIPRGTKEYIIVRCSRDKMKEDLRHELNHIYDMECGLRHTSSYHKFDKRRTTEGRTRCG